MQRLNYSPTKRKRKLTKMINFVKTMKYYIRHYESDPTPGFRGIRFIHCNGEKNVTLRDMKKMVADNLQMIKELV